MFGRSSLTGPCPTTAQRALSRTRNSVTFVRKFKYQSAREPARTVQEFVDSESAQEYSVYSHHISDAEVDVIERNLRAAEIMRTVHFTFEKLLDGAILGRRPGSAHHLIASTFAHEFTRKMHAFHGHGEYPVACFGSTLCGTPGGRSKEGDQSFRPRTRRGEEAWPSVMVEVGYPGVLKFLRLDAEWWFLNSDDKTRFVILIELEGILSPYTLSAG